MVQQSTMIATPDEAVARIAYLTSDTVYSVQSSLKTPSSYSAALQSLSSTSTSNVYSPVVPRIEVLRANADPFLSILEEANAGRLATVTTNSGTLVSAIPHLYSLAKRPITIFVSLSNSSANYADITSLRTTGFTIYQALNAQEAQDLAIVARSVSLSTNTGSVVFFESAEKDQVNIEDKSLLQRLIPTDVALSARSYKTEVASVYSLDIPKRSVVSQNADGKDVTTEIAAGVASLVNTSLTVAFTALQAATSRQYSAFDYSGPANAESAILLFGSHASLFRAQSSSEKLNVGVLTIRVYRPWSAEQLSQALPAAVTKLAVCEQLKTKTTKWGPVFLDTLIALNGKRVIKLVAAQLGHNTPDTVSQALRGLVHNLQAAQPVQNLLVGNKLPDAQDYYEIPTLETAYEKILNQLFSSRLAIVNKQSQNIAASLQRNPEFALGALLAQSKTTSGNSNWIVGSDAWAYDLGNSGVHHLLATGINANMLIIDSTPYSKRNAEASNKRKKDIGLYAMNFGNAYVASVAVYSSYTQVLAAMIEADKFDGPSVVLAYLPYEKEDDTPVTVLQETKNAVESGYWPLYRYNPTAEEAGHLNFQLDSERLKVELKEFLKRENHLSQLAASSPKFAASLQQSYGSEVREIQKRKAKQAYETMLDGLSGAPLTILYASDGGNAENVAKRLQRRAKARTLKAKAMAMDDYPLEDLSKEPNLVLITSTAGQGEIPQNGRAFWDSFKSSVEIDLGKTKYAVFAMGDSHYWPRAADKHYYNKPGIDLFHKAQSFGGEPLIEITSSMGDDQDPDGYETGYQAWEPQLWKALGVDHMDVVVDEPKERTPEDVKLESNFLRGGIVEGLKDPSTGAISADDALLTKFHGTYMQDDRDLREQRKADGLEPAYSFMIRARLAGGVATPKQWCQMSDICDELGNHTMKLTTRGTFQWHGVLKKNLKKTIASINKAMITTIAACGDVNRNVTCSAAVGSASLHKQAWTVAKGISDHLLPSTTAYHEIWLTDDDGKKAMVAGDAIKDQDDEPLYGPTYLPRKFKIAVAIPPSNDVDVFTNDVGFIAIAEGDKIVGYNVSIGGGMGTTHNNKKTYPRLGSIIGFCKPEQCNKVAEGVMICQRDHGDRKDRKHARLKYTVDDYGVPFFKEFVEKYIGYSLEEPRKYRFDNNIDDFGWHKDEDGKNHYVAFIENGRIEDTADFQMKTGLYELATILKHDAEFRLTANQHLIISKIEDSQLEEVKDVLAKYKLDNLQFSGLRLASSACVAFPTCGLAMAESERYLPILITKVEEILSEHGLEKEAIVMRMSGCGNACSRPYAAEIAFVGKAPGTYNMLLGADHTGVRLNKLYKSSVQEAEILDILRPMIKNFATTREDGEHFGDWCIRTGVIVATREGKDFHDDVPEFDELQAA